MAKLLHVTPRTLHNWVSGRYDIPYAAYKLLRVLLRYELPGDDWQGWHFTNGKLFTPEGRYIEPWDSDWWSLMVRKARQFHLLYDVVADMGRVAVAQGTTAPGAGASATLQAPGAGVPGPESLDSGRRAAPGLDLSLRHFGTGIKKSEERRGLRPHGVASKFVTNGGSRS